jgi:hypothetical protein
MTFMVCQMYAKGKWAIPARAETSDFVAQRYRENRGSFTLDRWFTPMTKFGVLGGLNLQVRGQAAWRRPGAIYQCQPGAAGDRVQRAD